MKLLCVDSGVHVIGGIRNTGKGLVEGNEYETNGEAYIDIDGRECYYIVGLGSRLKFRFTRVLSQVNLIKVKQEDFQLN